MIIDKDHGDKVFSWLMRGLVLIDVRITEILRKCFKLPIDGVVVEQG